MKLHSKHLLLACLCGSLTFSTPLLAEENPDKPEVPKADYRDHNGVPSIERFLHLSDEQLDRLMKGIERIRAMTPEERKDFAEEMRNFRRLPPEQRDRIRQRMRTVSPEDHEDIRTMIESMRPRERRRMLREMQGLDPEERMEYRLERLRQWRERKQPEDQSSE